MSLLVPASTVKSLRHSFQSQGYRDTLAQLLRSAHATLAKKITNMKAMTQSMSMSTQHDTDEQHARAADTVGETNAFSYTTKQKLG